MKKKKSCFFLGHSIFILDEFLLLHVCCNTQTKLVFIVLRAEQTTKMPCIWIFRQQSCIPISLVCFHCSSRHRQRSVNSIIHKGKWDGMCYSYTLSITKYSTTVFSYLFVQLENKFEIYLPPKSYRTYLPCWKTTQYLFSQHFSN